MIVKKHRKDTAALEKIFFNQQLRSSRILSSKHRVSPYLENIDEIWQ